MIDINSAWQELKSSVENCKKCGLCETRHNTVFGEGSMNCKAMIIGEAPGEDEDLQGKPFVGKAGQLLTDILEKGGGILRSSVYIANAIKCRPPENRDPAQKELFACNDFLEAQILLLRPKIIVTLGNISTKWLLKTSRGITSLRGQWFDWRGIKLLPMFHPSYLLRDPSRKIGSPKDLTWQDVRALKAKIDEME
ncbi:MAG: uracil-DNA glycosylase [Synergistaceae bacterium]|nr:uracil-DNA glycosylase [Synergistaceae bacterium]